MAPAKNPIPVILSICAVLVASWSLYLTELQSQRVKKQMRCFPGRSFTDCLNLVGEPSSRRKIVDSKVEAASWDHTQNFFLSTEIVIVHEADIILDFFDLDLEGDRKRYSRGYGSRIEARETAP